MSAELHALAGAYAVDALPADERAAFEEHLATCEACRTEVAELSATAARLGEAAAETPPAGLKERVLAEVDRVRPLPPQVGAEQDADEAPAPAPGGASGHGEAADVVSGPVPSGRARGRGRRRAPPAGRVVLSAAAAVTVAVAAVAGVLVSDLRGDLDREQQRTQALTRVLAAPDARTLSTDVRGGGRASVVVSGQRDRAVLVADGLDAAPEGRTYQAWFVGADGPASAGLVDTDDGGAVRVLAGDLARADTVALTVEPAGGSEQPTTDPVLAVSLDG
jgi:anti-sigma-K factor RskA